MSGAGLARGYLHSPGLTAERFLPSPFGESGGRVYRTGDLVRRSMSESDELEYVGRRDQQVKVRGQRIELGEIEARMLTHPDVRQAVVVVREDVPGDRRLAAFVVGDAESGEIRDHLRRVLPEYMVPERIEPLTSLPLTPNGKVDRKALARSLAGPPAVAAAAELVAMSPVEEQLRSIWREVLRIERVAPQDSFFDLGGNSLLAIEVGFAVEERFGVQLPMHVILEKAQLSTLAQVVEAGLPAADEGAA